MTWLDVTDFIKMVGFPIFVAVFLLIRVESVLKNLVTAIHELSRSITSHFPKTKEEEKNEIVH